MNHHHSSKTTPSTFADDSSLCTADTSTSSLQSSSLESFSAQATTTMMGYNQAQDEAEMVEMERIFRRNTRNAKPVLAKWLVRALRRKRVHGVVSQQGSSSINVTK